MPNPILDSLPKVENNRLTERETVNVKGKISFARIASLIEGAELTRRIQNSKSLHPTREPHTTIAISDAEIILKDPNAPTMGEAYVYQKFYKSAKNNSDNYNIDRPRNKRGDLPTVMQIQEDGHTVNEIGPLSGDPDAGVEVVLQIGVFPPGQNNTNGGAGLNNVIIMQPGNFPMRAPGGVSASALSSLGLTFGGTVANTATATAGGASNEAVVGTDANGLPTAAPAAPAQQAPAADPFTAGAPQAQPAQQPQAGGWGAPQPQAQAQAAQPQAPAERGGPQQQAPAQPAQPQQSAPAGWGGTPQSVTAPVAQPAAAAGGSAFGGEAPAQPAQPAQTQAPAQANDVAQDPWSSLPNQG